MKRVLKEKNLVYYILGVLVIILGAFVRLKLWFLNLGLHCDEANLALNMMSRGYFELFKPLSNAQVAPPMFLIFSKLFYNIAYLHYTAWFSDLILRLVSLLSGIFAIPVFGYLLNSLFKNKIVNIMGMLLLSINLGAISYSAVFKQYSFELLFTLVMLIIFTKIDFETKTLKQNAGLFSLLALSPAFAMISFFIMPGGFLYLAVKFLRKKYLKNFMICIGIFSLIFSLYCILVILPVYLAQYDKMADFWPVFVPDFKSYIMFFTKLMFRVINMSYYNLAYILVMLGLIAMLYKNYKHILLLFAPLYVSYIATVHGHWAISERFFVYLLPIFFSIILYPLTLFSQETISRYNKFFGTILAVLIICAFTHIPPVQNVIYKQEVGRRAWEYLASHWDGKTPVVIAASPNTNKYYKEFYGKNLIFSDTTCTGKNVLDRYKSLPPGDYYLIETKYVKKDKLGLYIRQNETVYDCKIFTSYGTYPYITLPSKSLVVKFRKSE